MDSNETSSENCEPNEVGAYSIRFHPMPPAPSSGEVLKWINQNSVDANFFTASMVAGAMGSSSSAGAPETSLSSSNGSYRRRSGTTTMTRWRFV